MPPPLMRSEEVVSLEDLAEAEADLLGVSDDEIELDVGDGPEDGSGVVFTFHLTNAQVASIREHGQFVAHASPDMIDD